MVPSPAGIIAAQQPHVEGNYGWSEVMFRGSMAGTDGREEAFAQEGIKKGSRRDQGGIGNG
jgi:hypothetical protein